MKKRQRRRGRRRGRGRTRLVVHTLHTSIVRVNWGRVAASRDLLTTRDRRRKLITCLRG